MPYTPGVNQPRDGFLSTGGKQFIVVGISHTLGPDSIELQQSERIATLPSRPVW